MPWSEKTLQAFIADRLAGRNLIVVSNREPYQHRKTGGKLECIRPAGGMSSALIPIMRACGGRWIAHGGGEADREVCDGRDRVLVPPEGQRFTLRRVWLPRDVYRRFYYGMANEGLWPLCHVAFRQPVFRGGDWEAYRRANEVFAEAVLEEAGDGDALVFIQDYHFGLLPRMLKRRKPELFVAQFWHIPWPHREVFRVFPWDEMLLDGLLGNDLIGFQLPGHCRNFMDAVGRNLEAIVDPQKSSARRGGSSTAVRPFPISIDFRRQAEIAASPFVDRAMERWRRELGLGPMPLGIGIDRMDYTKGIPERLQAIDRLLQLHPEFRGRFRFFQVAVPSRTEIKDYRRLQAEVDSLVQQTNARWQSHDWQPIELLHGRLASNEMAALHRLARFCIVSSLDDGMNLVAKEFVASRNDEQGVLILSRFAGAARELEQALQVNPFDADGLAAAIRRALVMPAAEQARRMRSMRLAVAENNIYRWAAKILTAAARLGLDSKPDSWPEEESAWLKPASAS